MSRWVGVVYNKTGLLLHLRGIEFITLHRCGNLLVTRLPLPAALFNELDQSKSRNRIVGQVTFIAPNNSDLIGLS